MAYQARCNKRACQARRNLSKPLEQYKHPPKCHMAGCNGFMYLDKRRNKFGGSVDCPPICRDPLCRFEYKSKKRRSNIHHIGTMGCSGYAEYIIDRSLRGPVKNTPFITEPEKDPPF